VEGNISVKEEEQPKIICEDVKPLKKIKVSKLYIKFTGDESNSNIKPLKALLRYFGGSTPVYFYNENTKKVDMLERECWVFINDVLLEELRLRYGEENVKVV
jgi:DNA polymerase-3 subunit alpha